MQKTKDRLYKLFDENFTITAFYKSTDTTREAHYIILDKVVQLRLNYVHGVVVIDEVTTLSKAYLKPIYDKIITVLKKQKEFTILVSTMTSSNILVQSCIQAELPLVMDDRYITIPKRYYDDLVAKVASDPNLGISLGFYIVAVVDSVDNPLIGRANQLNRISDLLRQYFPEVKITTVSDTVIDATVFSSQGISEFEITLIEQKLLIQDIHNTTMADIGFVQLSNLISCISRFLEVSSEVYIVNVRAVEVQRICEARGYLHVNENTTLIHSNLFKHIHCNYGTYRVIIK